MYLQELTALHVERLRLRAARSFNLDEVLGSSVPVLRVRGKEGSRESSRGILITEVCELLPIELGQAGMRS